MKTRKKSSLKKKNTHRNPYKSRKIGGKPPGIDNIPLLKQIETPNTLEICLNLFRKLEDSDTELIEKNCFSPFRVSGIDFKINKYDRLFDKTFDIFTFNPKNYNNEINPICISYSLYAKLDQTSNNTTPNLLKYSISSLLNLLKTCNVIKEFTRNISTIDKSINILFPNRKPFIIRLYANPNVFIPSEKTKNNIDYDRTQSILKKLLEFPFFEFHQIYIPNFSEKYTIERERFFRFFSIFDESISIAACKDIDSVITHFELENLYTFLNDNSKKLMYYDFYSEKNSMASNRNNRINADIIKLELEGNTGKCKKTQVLQKFASLHPSWLHQYQLIFYNTLFKYQIPAGLFAVKKDTINLTKFIETLNLVMENIQKIYSKIFDLEFMNKLEKIDWYSFHNLNSSIKIKQAFEIGFDEIFLMNLFQSLSKEQVVEIITIEQSYYVPKLSYYFNKSSLNASEKYSLEPHSNDYITPFKQDEESIYYTPILITPNSEFNKIVKDYFSEK
jgi:hypothetical protein